VLPAHLFTLKQKKSGYALRYKKLSFNKCWTQEKGRFEHIVFFLLSLGVESLFLKSVGRLTTSAGAECLFILF